ncbi:MAG: hypothetical protein ACQESP_06095 [Candidatus Muiribacteriota bacterium]
MKNICEKFKEEFIIEPARYFVSRLRKKKISSFVIVLHFNQSYSDYFEVAYKVCYKPLMKLICDYSNLKILINFSATFIEGIRNYPEGMKMLKQIVQNPNIKIIQSLPSQNIPGILREDIEGEMIPSPVGHNPVFWIPERSWNLNFLKKLAKKKYKWVFLENIKLKKKNKKYYLPFLDQIKIFPDEVYARHLLDSLILYGRNIFKTKNYILKKKLIVWAEDAEVAGLWSYERGQNPEKALNNLKKFFCWLESDNQIQTIFPWEFDAEYYNLNNYKNFPADYTASWIKDSFNGIINQFYEKGYKDFKDYSSGKKIKNFNFLINNYWDRIKNPVIPLFIQKELKKILIFHLYEYGCPGVGFEDRYLWGGINKVSKYLIALESGFEDENNVIEISSGFKATRKIYIIKKREKIYFFDNYGQLVSFIDINKNIFRHNELKFSLNGFYDEDYNAIKYKTKNFEECDFEIHQNTLILKFKNRVQKISL